MLWALAALAVVAAEAPLSEWLVSVGAAAAKESCDAAGVETVAQLHAHAASDPDFKKMGLPMKLRKRLTKVRNTPSWPRSWANFSRFRSWANFSRS